MKTFFFTLAAIIIIASCGKSGNRHQEVVEEISSAGKQDSVFQGLLASTHFGIPEDKLSDSLVFLLLPVRASCPACRRKAVDSIVKHQNKLLDGHYIIISANGGRKTIGSYFKERKSEIPDMPNLLFLDSTNEAHKHKLFKDNPAIYFTHNKKAYKKITAIPATVKQDLQEFFSGYRNQQEEP